MLLWVSGVLGLVNAFLFNTDLFIRFRDIKNGGFRNVRMGPKCILRASHIWDFSGRFFLAFNDGKAFKLVVLFYSSGATYSR